jgi:hypothetical protein
VYVWRTVQYREEGVSSGLSIRPSLSRSTARCVYTCMAYLTGSKGLQAAEAAESARLQQEKEKEKELQEQAEAAAAAEEAAEEAARLEKKKAQKAQPQKKSPRPKKSKSKVSVVVGYAEVLHDYAAGRCASLLSVWLHHCFTTASLIDA